MAEGPSPAEVVATGDPGDDTARRYTYQYTYTAILACGLLNGGLEEVVEIYCEHHDDILLKRTDGKFHAIQVKTRRLGADLWRARDDDIVHALSKFARLETDFPGHFARYTIATNHQFYEVKETAGNLSFLLRRARDTNDIETAWKDRYLGPFLKKLCRASGCEPAVVLSMLKKLDCDHQPPKLDDIAGELRDAVRTCHPAGEEASYASLAQAAAALTHEVRDASSLQHAQSIPLYLSLRLDGVEESGRRLIDGKRLTRERLERVLRETVQSPTLLVPAHPTAPAPLPVEESRLKLKLEAGGLPAVTIDMAVDLYSAAFVQQRTWAAKYGESRALDRYHHISSVVRTEAGIAYAETESTGAPFGKAMLARLQRRLRERLRAPTTATFDCLEEHLLGYAFILTEECKLLWSRTPPPTVVGR